MRISIWIFVFPGPGSTVQFFVSDFWWDKSKRLGTTHGCGSRHAGRDTSLLPPLPLPLFFCTAPQPIYSSPSPHIALPARSLSPSGWDSKASGIMVRDSPKHDYLRLHSYNVSNMMSHSICLTWRIHMWHHSFQNSVSGIMVRGMVRNIISLATVTQSNKSSLCSAPCGWE